MKVLQVPQKTLSGFSQFIHDYGVASLAIGVAIGNAVNDLVKIIADGLITPLISLVSPSGVLQTLQFTFHGAVFKIGAVLNGLLSFIIIALLIYLAIGVLLKQQELLKKK